MSYARRVFVSNIQKNSVLFAIIEKPQRPGPRIFGVVLARVPVTWMASEIIAMSGEDATTHKALTLSTWLDST